MGLIWRWIQNKIAKRKRKRICESDASCLLEGEDVTEKVIAKVPFKALEIEEPVELEKNDREFRIIYSITEC